METNLFADFLWYLLDNITEENLKNFYSMYFADKSVGTFDFHELIPFKARILAILLRPELEITVSKNERKELIEHLYAFYETYESLAIRSNRTIIPEDEINAINKYKRSGDLNTNEFNIFFYEFFKDYFNNFDKLQDNFPVYYNRIQNKLIVKYYHPKEHAYEKVEYLIAVEPEKNKCKNAYYLIAGKCKIRLKTFSSSRKHGLQNGYKQAIKIHKELLKSIPKHKESCIWCNPISKTKHKCAACMQLLKVYNEIRQEIPELPKDLNQIIKRVKKNEIINILEYRRIAKNKIKNLYTTIKNKHIQNNKNVNYYKIYQSSLLEALDNAFGSNE